MTEEAVSDSKLQTSWKNTMFVDMRLMGVDARDVQDCVKWRDVGWFKWPKYCLEICVPDGSTTTVVSQGA